MTLDEAIKDMEMIAEENQRVVDTGIVFDDVTIDELYCDDTEVIEEHLANYQKCAEEHHQIAEWLKELKRYREAQVTDAVDRVTIKEYLDSYNVEINTPADYKNDIVGEGVDFNKEVDKNILCVINGLPLVHLKGHLSMHFDPYKMRFVYLSLKEVPVSEFITACEAKGMFCDITNNEITIKKEEIQIVISPEGKVFINDIPFSIDDQIKQDKNMKDMYQAITGKWIVKGESWCCSRCNEPVCEIYDGEPYQKYCPSCGSKNIVGG